jgi:hypothetical protein
MDVYNHGTWNFAAPSSQPKQQFSIEVGVNRTGGGKGTIESLGVFTSDPKSGNVQMVFDASTRASGRIRTEASDFWQLVDQFEKQDATPLWREGKVPTKVPIYADFFNAGTPGGGGGEGNTNCPKCGVQYTAAQTKMQGQLGIKVLNGEMPVDPTNKLAYIDLRGRLDSHADMAKALQAIVDAKLQDHIHVVSLGDELTVEGGNTSDPVYAQWCKAKGLTPAGGCTGHVNTSTASATGDKVSNFNYYYSTQFSHEQAYGYFKEFTDQILAVLPNANVGVRSPRFDLMTFARRWCLISHLLLGLVKAACAWFNRVMVMSFDAIH